ncbi:hypothetical protein GCM10010519_29600 [Streptomyces lactacystinicus]
MTPEETGFGSSDGTGHSHGVPSDLMSIGRSDMDPPRRGVHHVHKLLAVWDGLPARGQGETADVVALARSRGVPVEIVWPEGPCC